MLFTWWLLVVTVHYHSLLLVPTFGMNVSLKLFYLHYSCKKVVEKSNNEKLKGIKNTFPNKSGNPEGIKK